MSRLILGMSLLLSSFALQGCAVAVGAAGAVVVDEVMEQERGGDGLF